MLFKLLFIGCLVYVFYKLVMPKGLPGADQQILDDKAEDDEFVDYEEID